MNVRRSILLVLLSVAVMIGATPLRGEEFYESQLRLGRSAMAAGEPLRAAEHCRIASFGLMDRPPLLTESLVCLSLASSAAGRSADVDAAIRRFLEVEQRFPSYAVASIEDSYRRSFDTLLLATVDRDRLAAIPTLANLGAPRRPVAAPPRVIETAVIPAPVIEEVPVAPASEPAREPEPVVVEREEVARVEEPREEVPAPVVAVPAPAPAIETPRESVARPAVVDGDEADRVLTAARRLINTRRAGDAAKILYRQLQKTPARRDLRLALLESSTLDKDWRTGAAQTDLLQPFATGEENSMFYAAVALFETGRRIDAKRLLSRAKDQVPKTEYVRYYTKRIEQMQ